MERMTLTTIGQLKKGDRFFLKTDNKREVWEKVDCSAIVTAYQTYKDFAIMDKMLWVKHPQPKAFKSETKVVFFKTFLHSIRVTNKQINMKPLDAYVPIIETKFPKCVPLDHNENNYFREGCVLFKNDTNVFCSAELSENYHLTRQVFITLFQCDWKGFDRIESEYANSVIRFSFNNTNDFKTFIKACF
jgi:hypothetical protein